MVTRKVYLSFFILALFAATTAPAQLIPLAPERTSHAATMLQSGKVLVTGGVNESTVLSSALLYDPATGVITVTGSMTTPRENHTSTLLPDGRVLITGGDQGGTPLVLLQTAETYDPVTGTFTVTPQGMRTPRTQHTATLLSDGTVLVVGGQSADIFDPSGNSFTQTIGTPVQGRKSHLATRLGDGTVLITGGYIGNIATDTAEIYNPGTQTFAATPNLMIIPRANHTSTLLPSGGVFITGGFSGTSPHSETEIYDPATQTFTLDTPMLFHRSNHQAVLQGDGQVLVIGGVTLESGFLAVNEIYNPANKTWTEHGQLLEDRGGHTATTLLSGNVLVAGGVTGNQTLQSAEILDPITHQFTSLGNMQVPRNQHTATLLQDGRVLLTAGSTDTATLTSAEIFNPADNTFRLLDSTLVDDRKNHSATLLNDGRVLIAGGRNSLDGKLRSAELFDPLTELFTVTATMKVVRALHTATLLNDGKPLLIGGVITGGGETDTAETYDPVTETFRLTIGKLKFGRKRHRASLLNDGTVLVTGGTILANGQGGGDRTTETAELFDPTTATFSQVGDMSVARSDHDSVLLEDGSVVITGGTIAPEVGDLYDTTLKIFNPTANSMLESRGRLVSLRLNNPAWGSLTGQVLAIGGSDIGGTIFGGAQVALDSVEIYDPATNQFTNFGTMTAARQNHTATELQDGRVLITGGVGPPFISGTAEVVDAPTPSPTPTPTPTPTPSPTPGKPLNISTRLNVGTGDNVLIGGLIINGTSPKKLLVRGIGPSLTAFGVPGALADPTLELLNSAGSLASNDNWRDTQEQEITATGLQPTNNLESAILATLDPGSYTAILRGNNTTTGTGLVEVYDLDPVTADTALANISTRGLVQTGDDVMIAGFIISEGGRDAQLLLRGIGPSLTAFGVTGALADPVLELHNSNGDLVASNDSWKANQQADIEATGLPPTNDAEAAILVTLPAGSYTAIESGKNGGTGVGLVEVYYLP